MTFTKCTKSVTRSCRLLDTLQLCAISAVVIKL